MTKSLPIVITVPLVQFSINSTPKPCMTDVVMSIEKGNIYFGPNWKLPFSFLSPDSFSSIESIVDDYEHNLEVTDKNLRIVLESDDSSKIFACVFGRVTKKRQEEVIKFLRHFVKRYVKWEYKQTRKTPHLLQEHDSHARTYDKSKTYGRRTGNAVDKTRNETLYKGSKSRFFADKSFKKTDHQWMDASDSQSFRRTSRATGQKPKYKSKLDKLKEKMRHQLLYEDKYASDENNDDHAMIAESKTEVLLGDPAIESESESIQHESLPADDVVKDDTLPTKKRTHGFFKRNNLRKKSKLVQDDDSDIEFNGPARSISHRKVSQFLEDDDDEDDDHDDDEKGVVPQKDSGPLNTNLTQETTQVATITPLRSQNASSLVQNEPVDDVVTDDEVQAPNDAKSSPHKKPRTSGIQSFFVKPNVQNKPSSVTNGTTTKSASSTKPSIIRKKPMSPSDSKLTEDAASSPVPLHAGTTSPVPTRYEKLRPTKSSSHTTADQALDTYTPRKLRVASPKPKSVTFTSRSMAPQNTLTSPIRNPYQKSISPRKLEMNHVGLKNLGNTCYINSSLQMLFSLPQFLERLCATYKKLKSTLSNNDGIERMPLCHALLTVASAMKLLPTFGISSDARIEGAANPSSLKKEIDNLTDKFAGYEQRDAHEFLSSLIDMLHDELESTKSDCEDYIEPPTNEYFCLTVNVCLTCNSCEYSRSKQEIYRHLSIDIGLNADENEAWTVSKGLEKFFKPEVRDIKCEKCNVGTSVTQTISVTSRPKALLLHLKRFRIESKDGQIFFRKSTARVKSEVNVSLDTFMDKHESNSTNMYHLKGVVRHIGNSSLSGHYIADAIRKRTNDNGVEWINFDDGSPSLTSIQDVLESEGSQTNNYLMLYEFE